MNFDPIIALGTLLLNAVLSLSFFMPAMILAYVFEFLWNVMKDLIKCKFHNLMFWKKQEPKQYPHDYSILITGFFEVFSNDKKKSKSNYCFLCFFLFQGAGTGIGRGLAVEYVKKFVKIVEDDEGKSKDFKFQIFCVSRTAKTLETTKEKCEKIMKERETANEQAGKKPALNLFSKISVQIFPDTDVSDQEGYKSVYEKCCNLTSQKSIDLVIANAGFDLILSFFLGKYILTPNQKTELPPCAIRQNLMKAQKQDHMKRNFSHLSKSGKKSLFKPKTSTLMV